MLTAIVAVFFLLLSDINKVNAGGALAYKVVGDVVTIKDCKETASGALVIPAIYDGKPVTSIGSWAFWNCVNLSKVTIPDSVTSIGNFAFHSQGLEIGDIIILNEAFALTKNLSNSLRRIAYLDTHRRHGIVYHLISPNRKFDLQDFEKQYESCKTKNTIGDGGSTAL